MARPTYYSSSTTEVGSNSATEAVALPSHASGDGLLVFVATRTRSVSSYTAGWSSLASVTSGSYNYVLYKQAASASETLSLTMSGTGGAIAAVAVNCGQVTSGHTPQANSSNFASVSAKYKDSATLTTANDNMVVFHACLSDNTNSRIGFGGCVDINAAYSGAGFSYARVGFEAYPGAGAINQFKWSIDTTNRSGTVFAIGVRYDGVDSLPPQIADSRIPLVIGANYGPISTGVAPNNFGAITQMAGIPMDSVLAAASVPFSFYLPGGHSHGTQTTVNKWVGLWYPTASGVVEDLTDAIVTFSHGMFTQWDSSRAGPNGYVIVFKDSSDNWATIQLNSLTSALVNTVYSCCLDVSNMSLLASSETESGSSGVAIDWTDVTHVGMFWERKGSNTGTSYMGFNAICYSKAPVVVFGKNRGQPISADDVDSLLWANPLAANGRGESITFYQGVGQLTVGTGLQFGDGAQPTSIAFVAEGISFRSYDAKYAALTANKLLIDTKTTDSCIIDYRSAVFAADTRQKWRLNALGSAASAVTNGGMTIKGMDVDWLTGVDATNVAIISCFDVDMKGADLINCAFTNPQSTNSLIISESGATLDGCTIDGTGASYAIELGTAVTAITLNDCTLTAGSTDKVHVLKTTGTVTITISGTTALVAGDVTSAGATVVIAAPQPTLSATVLANTRVVLYNRTTDAELDNTFVTGTAWSKVITSGASAGDVLDLYPFKEGYAESRATLIYSGDDASFAVEQVVDDAIDYYRTEESVTDYTTLTEFNFYSPDIYIQSDDPDGATTLKRMFIFYNGALTTEDGARYMRGGVTFRSPFDVVINRSVVAMAVDNVSVTHGLYFTDESTIRVTTDNGTSWIALPSAPGSIRYAFGVAPGQIETGVSGLTGPESAQLMGLPSASATADAVWAKTLP